MAFTFFQDLKTAVIRQYPEAIDLSATAEARIPEALTDQDAARRYYGCVSESMSAYGLSDPEPAARIALMSARRLEALKIRDWRTNPDIINKMRGEIDDILFDMAEALGIHLSLEDQDVIIDRCMDAAITDED